MQLLSPCKAVAHGVFALGMLALAVTTSAQQVATPARAYLYLDPYVARFECLIRMTDMFSILGENPVDVLSQEMQKKLMERARVKAAGWLSLKIDDNAAQMNPPASVAVVKGSPGRTDALGPDEAVTLTDAMLGLVWEFNLSVVPQQIETRWNGFVVPIISLPVSVIMAGAPSEDFNLTAQSAASVWINRGRVNLRSPLAQVPPVLGGEHDFFIIPVATFAWIFVGLIFMGRKRRRSRRMSGRKLMRWAGLVLGAVVLWPMYSVKVANPWAPQVTVSPDQATKILTSLLRNIYRAFDQRTESGVYDALARSIQGDMLEKVYLQTANSLLIDEKSSTRLHVTELEARVDALKQIKKPNGFIADAQWTVLGTVGHWGHQHTRVNRYTAKVTVKPDIPSADSSKKQPASWKITALEILEEKRL